MGMVKRYYELRFDLQSAFENLGWSYAADRAVSGQRLDFLVEREGERVAVDALVTDVTAEDVDRIYDQLQPLLLDDEIDRIAIVTSDAFTPEGARRARELEVEAWTIGGLFAQERSDGDGASSLLPEVPEKRNIFVLMPFAKKFSDVYHAIQLVAKDVDCAAERADDIQQNRPILDIIFSKIAAADVIVADISDNNPNVFYEVGYCHHFRKETTILLANDINAVPFDLRTHNLVVYESIFDDLIPRLTDRLKATLMLLDLPLSKSSF